MNDLFVCFFLLLRHSFQRLFISLVDQNLWIMMMIKREIDQNFLLIEISMIKKLLFFRMIDYYK